MASPAAYNQKDRNCRALGLAPNPTRDEIKSAYKALALQWHPDRHSSNKEHAKDRFIEINTAYQALMRARPSPAPRTSSSESSASDTESVPASDFYFQSAHGSASSQTSFTPSSPRSTSSRASSQDDLNETTPKASRHKSKKGHHSGSSRHSEGSHHSESSRHSDSGRHSEGSHHSEGGRHSEGSHHSASGRHPEGSHHSESGRHASRHPGKSDHHGEKSSHRSEKSDHHGHSSSKSHGKKSSKHHHHDHHEHHNREKKAAKVEEVVEEDESELEQRPPTIGIPLRPSRSPGSQNSDWIFPLPLTLEEMHSGTSYRFQITRQLTASPSASAESLGSSSSTNSSASTIHIDLEVPPGGYKNGTQIRFEGIGNQRKSDGSFQDIVFVVQEIIHDRFARVRDDLVARIELAWDEDDFKEVVILLEGLDGENIAVPIPASPDSDRETRIPKAGMPIRNSEGRIIGRGDLVVRWEFAFPDNKSSDSSKSRWQTFKSAFTWQQHKPIV